MAEQISHKRSLRVKRLDEDKKRLLKEYYKLEEGGEQEPSNDAAPVQEEAQTSEHNDPSSESEGESGDRASPDLHPREMTLQQLLQVHNRLVGQEIEMGNSIKNTIYDNYYDLVKVNTLLAGVVSPETPGHRHDDAWKLLAKLRALNSDARDHTST